MKKIYIDCGAHNGVTIKPRLLDYDEIFGFEPSRQKYEKLIKKFALNENVTLFNKAVWTENTSLDFKLNENTLASSIYDHTYGKVLEEVKIEAIDFNQWIVDNFSPSDDITIKMDIEGAEFEVIRHMLEGGSMKYVDTMFVEFHNRFWNPRKPVRINNMLREQMKRIGVKIGTWR